MKIVRAIRQGRIIGSKAKTAGDKPQFYGIWNEPPSNQSPPLSAPKPALPTHAESYNPPEEYLPTAAERKEWENTDPEDREHDYLPQKYSSLRLVPAYDQFVKQRFNRQLDLYLAPRIQRIRLNIDPNSLIPKLPSPSSLRPFPNYRSLKFTHTNTKVRCVCTSPDGAWVASGDDDGNVSLWEVIVGREVRKWNFDGKIGAVEWCPRTDASYFVVGTYVVISSQSRLTSEASISREDKLYFVIPPNLPSIILHSTQSTLTPATLPPATQSPIKWSSSPGREDGMVLTILLPAVSGLAKQIAWHRKGDYLATVCTYNSSYPMTLPKIFFSLLASRESQGSVWIHQVSRRHSQAPFKKIKGAVQLVLFHPIKPHFFVAVSKERVREISCLIFHSHRPNAMSGYTILPSKS